MTDNVRQVRVIETVGSYWHIDQNLNRYRRFPKQEGPREQAEWGGPEAGSLQDYRWHDFTGRWFLTTAHLIIELEPAGDDGVARVVSAPLKWEDIAEVLADREWFAAP